MADKKLPQESLIVRFFETEIWKWLPFFLPFAGLLSAVSLFLAGFSEALGDAKVFFDLSLASAEASKLLLAVISSALVYRMFLAFLEIYIANTYVETLEEHPGEKLKFSVRTSLNIFALLPVMMFWSATFVSGGFALPLFIIAGVICLGSTYFICIAEWIRERESGGETKFSFFGKLQEILQRPAIVSSTPSLIPGLLIVLLSVSYVTGLFRVASLAAGAEFNVHLSDEKISAVVIGFADGGVILAHPGENFAYRRFFFVPYSEIQRIEQGND